MKGTYARPLFMGSFVATEKLVFNIFDVSSRRSDDFPRRRMSLVRSILEEVQLYSTPLEPPSVEPSDDS